MTPVPREETSSSERRILVIADTHGSLPDWICERRFETVLHAGDVGDERVLTMLHCHGTAYVVRGNTDGALPGLPETVRTDIDGVRFFLVHNLTAPHRLMPGNAAALADWRPRVVVFGHTHQPLLREQEGIVYLNPGALGRETEAQRTYAVVTLRDGAVCRIEVHNAAHRTLLSWP